MKHLIILMILASAAWAQTPTYGSTAQAGAIVNNSAATTTRPVAEKASDPATCTEGERYYNTTLHKGRLCTGTNTWADEASAGAGDVTGPASSTANGIARFSGTGGKTLKNSGITIDDSNNLNVPGIISAGDGTVAGELVAQEVTSNGTEYLSWLAPDSRATTLRMLLPTADPQAGQVMLFGAPSSAKSTITWGTPVLAASTDTLTNKTLDAEGTGNAITLSSKIWLPAAGCAGTTGTLMWDTLAANAPTATCSAGSTETTMMRGAADFPDSDGAYSLQQIIMLPDDWTGAVDVKFLWKAAATSGDAVWQVATSCVADAEANDAAYNTANTVTDTAKGTTLQLNTATITGITMTGCAAGELLHLKVQRDRTHASDSITGVISLIGVEVTTRRAM